MTPLDPRVPGATAGLPRSMRILLGIAGRIVAGSVTIRMPDGRSYRVTGPKPGPEADLTVRRPRMVSRLIFGGSVGFGTSYMDGDWETSDLAALLILAALGTVGFRLRSTFTENLQIPLCELRASPVREQGQRGDQVIVRLPIHNRGHRSAMILGATPTCGVRCLSQLPLCMAPNETVELLFQFRFPGHSANTVVWITLFTNDSKTIRKLISFAARR